MPATIDITAGAAHTGGHRLESCDGTPFAGAMTHE